ISRLCVSPFMEEDYARRYHARGIVLYPCRAADTRRFDESPVRLHEQTSHLTFLFAGSINTPGYAAALRLLSRALSRTGGRLLIYGPLSKDDAGRYGLGEPNIEIRGLVPASELIERSRKESDVIFVPMSFDPWDEPNMRLGFPSKLADSTVV